VSFPAGYHAGVEAHLARCAAMRAQVHGSQQVPLDDSSRTSPINVDTAAVWTSAGTSRSHLLHRSYLSSGDYLLDRRTGESNQDSLVSVRMKFCSALRSNEVEITRVDPRRPPGSLSLQRATKQVAKPFGVPSISLQLITHRATVSVVLFYNSRLSEHKGAREEAFRSGNRKVSEGWDVLGLFLSYQLPTHCSFRGVSWSGSPIWFMLELP
jgi:hypothetical protein